jgi:multisubunit Na+/H+ antiporter MnhF subunit
MAQAPTFATHRLLHAALTMSVVAYGIAAIVLLNQPAGSPPPLSPWVLVGLSLAMTAAIPVFRILYPPTTGKRLVQRDIVSWALCDAIAIYGLVATMFTHQSTWFFALAALAVVNLGLYRPNAAIWRQVNTSPQML